MINIPPLVLRERRDADTLNDVNENGPPAPVHRLLSGWGRTAPSAADVVEVLKSNQVSPLLAGAPEGGAIARGLGRSYGDAAQNAGGTVLGMTGLNGVTNLDLDAGTVTAAGGTSLDDLMRLLLPFGYFVPVTPGTRFVTLGGALAADIHGKNHHVDGSIQRHVLAFTLETPGVGAIDVTPESHADVFRATLGGMGLTGVITSATLRLTRVETAYMCVDTEKAANLDDALARLAFADDSFRYSVAWLDSLARGKKLGRAVLMRANHATRDALPPRAARNPLAMHGGSLGSVPPIVPGGLVTATTIGPFNEAYFRLAPGYRRGEIQHLTGYFHPLDRIRDWNRGYGRRGFVQYQFVVPDGQEGTLRRVLERFADARLPSLVTVLKRFGPGEGMLSFPIEGWTLALDFPATASDLAEVLDECDRMVANAGGRIYLAKDARADPSIVHEMYPDLERWREVRATLDPGNVMRSDLARRLELL